MSDICVFDGQVVGGGGDITAGSNALSCSGTPFVPTDVGKLFRMPGAGPAASELDSSIVTVVSPNEVLLLDNASSTVDSGPFWWGTDVAPPLQAAINNGVNVALPSGLGLIGSTLTVPGHLKLEGTGRYSCQIQPPANKSAISIAVPSGGYDSVLVDFGISYASQQLLTSPAAITATALVGEHSGFDARCVGIIHASWGIIFGAASYFSIDKAHIINSSCGGILVQNTNNCDSGDSTISNSWIFNPSITSGSTLGVLQVSSGGLRISNCKFNSFNQAIQLRLAPGAVTCDLLITDNSMESVGFSNPNAPILCQRQGSTGSFHSLIADGNQFNGWGYNFANIGGIVNAVGNSPAWLTNVVIGTNAVK